MERPSLRKKKRQKSIVRPDVANVPTDEVILMAPVASVSLLVSSQVTSSVRSASSMLFKTAVSSLSGPFVR